MSSRWLLLCEGSSIRGVQKIVKSKAPFTRILWTLFVVLMTLVLVVTSGFLVGDYLAYDTSWHTATAFDYRPAFPSFTICSHQPFGSEAEATWRRGSVMSPPQFQGLLRQISANAVATGLGEPMDGLFGYDNVNTYYQQLSHASAVSIGMGASSLFLCMISVDGMQVIAENCVASDEFANLSVRLFPHSEFFNCYTVDASAARGIESIVVLVSLVPSSELPTLADSFVYDVLSRGEGVKVALHETGAVPDLAQSGFNAEPGRLNEVNYATTGWRMLRSPKHLCSDNQPPVRHLGVEYWADYHQCTNAQLQRLMLRRCRCINSLWPVPRAPEAPGGAPYCIDLTSAAAGSGGDLSRRLSCANGVLLEAEQLRRNLSAACQPRCAFFTYESTLSATHWSPSPSKLAALADQYKAQMDRGNDSSARLLATLGRAVSQYGPGQFGTRLSRQAGYTCLKIKRKNWDVTWKLEKLTLDFSILLSRVGGLCSLCIGLTAAFVVELVEFVYLSIADAAAGTPAVETPSSAPMVETAGRALMSSGDPWEKSDCADFGSPGKPQLDSGV